MAKKTVLSFLSAVLAVGAAIVVVAALPVPYQIKALAAGIWGGAVFVSTVLSGCFLIRSNRRRKEK